MQNPYAGVVMDPDIKEGGTQELVYQTVAEHVKHGEDGTVSVCASDVVKSLVDKLNTDDDGVIPEYVPSDGDEQEAEMEVGENDKIESMSVGSAGSYAARLLALSEQKLVDEVKQRMEEKRKMEEEITALRAALTKRNAEEAMAAVGESKKRVVASPVRYSDTPTKSPQSQTTLQILNNPKEFGKFLGENTPVFNIGKYKCFDSAFSRGMYVGILRSAFLHDERFADMTINDLITHNGKGRFVNLQKLVDAYPVPYDNKGFFMNNQDTPQNKMKMMFASLCMLKAAPKQPEASMMGAKTGGLFSFGAPQ